MRPADKIERAGQAEQQILSGKAVSGEVLLEALAEKLNKVGLTLL